MLGNINFCHGILPLPPFFTFWDIPFHCSLYCVVWDGRGCSILVAKLSAGSRLTLGQTENRELSQELPTKGPTIYLLREGVGDFWSSRIFFLAIWWVGYFFPFFPISFLLHLRCMQLFSPDKRLHEIFFQNHPPPPEELNGPPLSCLVPQLVPGPHYYSRAALASRVTWSKRRSWENAVHVVQTKNKQTWRRSRWMEKVSYFLQRFLYGFKSTLQKGNVQLKKVLN